MIATRPLPVHRAAVLLADEAATAALAARLAPHLKPGDMVALRGDLGAGKTSFARALIRSLGPADQEVPSPTFTLVQTYDLPVGPVWHFDLYRLVDATEVEELGWDEARAQALVLVEWPDRLGPYEPAERLEITLDVAGETQRRATLAGTGAWAARLAGMGLVGGMS